MKSSKLKVDLSIVIPAYAEEKRIGATLDELAAYLKSDQFFRKKQVEVLVVATDGHDNTAKIVKTKQALFKDLQLLQPGQHVGKGRDVQYGMLCASGRFTVFMDADLATPLHHLESFYISCAAGSDLVVGTRNLLTYRSNVWRGLFAWFGNILYRLGSGIWIEDTQCGFKMLTADAAKLCFSRMTIPGWGFDIEILAIAKANKLKIKPVRLNDWQHMPFSTHTDSALLISVRSTRDFAHVTIKRFLGTYAK